MFDSKRSAHAAPRPQDTLPAASTEVGKRSAVSAAEAVARRAPEPTAVQALAARGIATPASPVPFLDTIQRAFGRHDISHVQAHTDGAASDTAEELRADGYATGHHVVLGRGRDLHTVAHECAHVIQQQGGVAAKGGLGRPGDAHERHADAVADLVVRGESAEQLLDQYAGASGGGSATTAEVTQCKLSVGEVEQSSLEATWARIAGDARFSGIQDEARQLLSQWIDALPRYPVEQTEMVSADRRYASDEELIRGLAGDVRAAANLAREGELARQTIDDGHVNAALAGVIAKLRAFQTTNQSQLPSTSKPGRYGGWAYAAARMRDAALVDPGDLRGRIAMIADYALAVKRDVPRSQWNFQMTAEQNAGRATHWNTNEASEWTEDARDHDMPLSAGPSATTGQVLALADLLQCSLEEKTALAWALFTLWNDMPLNLAGTHRFHEVMDVAALHGVPYERFHYGEPPQA